MTASQSYLQDSVVLILSTKSYTKLLTPATLYQTQMVVTACYILAGTFKSSREPEGQSHTLTRSKDVYCLVTTTYKCDTAILKVYSDSVTRTAHPEVLRVLLYTDLAAHRVTANVSVVIAQLQRLRQEGLTLQGSEGLG